MDRHHDLFDGNDEVINGLLEEKQCLHKANQDDITSVSKRAAYNNICKTVQRRLRHAIFLAEQQGRLNPVLTENT